MALVRSKQSGHNAPDKKNVKKWLLRKISLYFFIVAPWRWLT